jgi:CubicO group peptidase (beta-lactamase class C family)
LSRKAILNQHFIEQINQLSPSLFNELKTIIEDALGNIFPAASLLIMRQGEICFEGSWGWIDPESERLPVMPDSLFDLASVSKLFTATAFLTFVSEGRIQLDDPLVSIIPEFGASGPRPMDGGQDPFTKAMLPVTPDLQDQTVDPTRVTFRHLLAHISGLAPWRSVYLEAGPTPSPPDQRDTVDRAIRWKQGLQAIYQYPFVDIPGRDIHYSDLGLILLGETVRRLYAGELDAALQTLVFDPLELKTLVFNPLQQGRRHEHIVPTEDDQTWRGRRCWGEVDDENTCGLGGVSGHAGLFGTARDVGVLGLAWLTHDSRLRIAPALIDEAVREQALSATERRGLGWQLQHPSTVSFSPDTFGHTGFTGTSLWVDPERQVVVACLTNRVYVGRERTGIDDFRRALHTTIVRHMA